MPESGHENSRPGFDSTVWHRPAGSRGARPTATDSSQGDSAWPPRFGQAKSRQPRQRGIGTVTDRDPNCDHEPPIWAGMERGRSAGAGLHSRLVCCFARIGRKVRGWPPVAVKLNAAAATAWPPRPVPPAVTWPAGAGRRRDLLASGPGSVQDQGRDLLRMGDQRQVAGVDLDRGGVHAPGEELLKLRRDRAILPRDGIPGRS